MLSKTNLNKIALVLLFGTMLSSAGGITNYETVITQRTNDIVDMVDKDTENIHKSKEELDQELDKNIILKKEIIKRLKKILVLKKYNLMRLKKINTNLK